MRLCNEMPVDGGDWWKTRRSGVIACEGEYGTEPGIACMKVGEGETDDKIGLKCDGKMSWMEACIGGGERC